MVFVPCADEPRPKTRGIHRRDEEKLKGKGGEDGRNNRAVGVFRAGGGGEKKSNA